MITPTPKTAVPCAVCKTTEGSRRSNGQPVRYRGEPFGIKEMVCATCRARLIRHQKAIAAGHEPGRAGRRAGAGPAKANRAKGTSVEFNGRSSCEIPSPGVNVCETRVSPEAIASGLREVREIAERDGRKPRTGLTDVERRQQQLASQAAADRRAVVEGRRQALGWHWSLQRARWPLPARESRRT